MSKTKGKVGFYLFERRHGRKNIGSSRIRGHWLIDKWDEAEEMIYSKLYDVLIYQKVYEPSIAKKINEDSDTLQILDMCDPDWLEYQPVVEMIQEVDAVTCSSKGLFDFLTGITNKPVKLIPDRVNLDVLPERKKHTDEKATRVGWFGYSHNDYVLEQVLEPLQREGLKLKVVSDAIYQPRRDKYLDMVEWVKWENQKQADKAIQECDFVVMPSGNSPRFVYKSQNKTYQSWALGLPVAKNVPELKRFIDPKERKKEADKRYKQVEKELTVEKSVEDFKELIGKVSGGENK
jgi:hypothetical protein